MAFSKIKSIKYIGFRHTYDLQVKKNNNFFLTNKLLSHNSGKSTTMVSLAQRYHDDSAKRYKIFDLFGGERKESYYWGLPSDEITYWKKNKKELKLKNEGPKQYQVHYLFPMWKNKIPNKLLQNHPYVRSSVFTIPLKSVEIEDIQLAMGQLSATDSAVWREVVEDLRNKDSGPILLHRAQKLAKKNQSIVRNFIKPLVDNQLLQSDNCDYNLDIVKEAKERDTITVLILEFVPKEYHLFVLGYIIRQINKALDEGHVRPKNIILMREVAEFFRATEESVLPDRYKLFRLQLSQFLRMARRGVFFFFDCQSPNETKGIVSGISQITISCRMPGEADREALCAQLKRDNLITAKQVADLAVLQPGEIMFIEVGKKTAKRYVLLPRTMVWKVGRGDFINNVWKKYVDKYENINSILEELNNIYDKEKENIIDIPIRIKKEDIKENIGEGVMPEEIDDNFEEEIKEIKIKKIDEDENPLKKVKLIIPKKEIPEYI